AALVILVIAFLSGLVRAQSINGSLTGRVTDPSKALIAEARIVVVNETTNARSETGTNTLGEYYLANLPPSTYRIEVEKGGFKKIIKENVTLHVQDALQIDFEMTIGLGSESITVEAGAPIVNSESAAVSTVVD